MNRIHFAAIACIFLFAMVFSAFKNSSYSPHHKRLQSDTVNPFARVKDYKGKSVVSTSGVITFTTGLDNDYYQADSSGRLVHFYVETRLAKLLNVPQRRTPLNISIVIDRSGSMQGIKMGYAKKAAKALIDGLEPVDYLSIVIYDNNIDSIQEPVLVTNKELIKSKIDGITPRGATNLWGGTDKGYDFVKKNYKPGYINRVLLISDGLANAGITDSIKIRQMVQKYKDEDGISLSTFGVGLDYNESLMTDMAETGAGNYYFIDHPDNMISQFNKELNGMLNVIAQEAELNIKLPQGVSIQSCYPLRYRQIQDVIIVKLRDLFAEETKAALFKFRIADGVKRPISFITKLSYTDVMDGLQKSTTNVNQLLPVGNANDYLTHYNQAVIQQTVLFTASENLERAMAQVDMGNYEAANVILQKNKTYLRQFNFSSGVSGFARLDSVNTSYALQLQNIRKMSPDSLKRLQKSSKAVNYQLRNKKQ